MMTRSRNRFSDDASEQLKRGVNLLELCGLFILKYTGDINETV